MPAVLCCEDDIKCPSANQKKSLTRLIHRDSHQSFFLAPSQCFHLRLLCCPRPSTPTRSASRTARNKMDLVTWQTQKSAKDVLNAVNSPGMWSSPKPNSFAESCLPKKNLPIWCATYPQTLMSSNAMANFTTLLGSLELTHGRIYWKSQWIPVRLRSFTIFYTVKEQKGVKHHIQHIQHIQHILT